MVSIMAKRANLDTDDLKVCRQTFFDLAVEKDKQLLCIGLAAELSGAMPSLESFLDLLPLHSDCEWISPDGVKPEQRISVETIDRKWRDRVLNSLPGFFRAVDKMPAACRLSPGVEIFRELHLELPVDGYPDLFRVFCQNPYAHKRFDYFRKFADYVNNFMSTLRHRLCSAVVRRRISDWCRSADRNCLEYCSYVRKLFEVTARLVVIRLDLGTERTVGSILRQRSVIWIGFLPIDDTILNCFMRVGAILPRWSTEWTMAITSTCYFSSMAPSDQTSRIFTWQRRLASIGKM